MRKSLLFLGGLMILATGPAAAGRAWAQTQTQTDYSAYEQLPCSQFISETLTRDPGFNQALQTYLQAKYARVSARAMAAWTLGASAGVVHSESTSGISFEPETVDVRTYELSVQKLFLETGSRLTLSHANSLSRLAYAASEPYVLDLGPGMAPLVLDFGGLADTSPETSTPNIAVSLVQPLIRNAFGLADRFPLQAASLQTEAAELDAQEAWENRIAELYNAYFSWAAAYENVRAFQEIVMDLQRLLDQVERKVQAGVAERTDLLRTQENILQTRSQLIQAEGNFKNETVRIAYLRAGRDVAPGDIPRVRPILESGLQPDPADAEAPEAERVDRLRLLRKLDLLHRQLEDRIAVAENSRLPSLDLVGNLTWKGRADDAGGGYGEINRKDYSVLLQAQYPLGAEQGRGETGQAQAGLAELERSREATRRDLTLSLVQMEESLRNLRDVLALNREQEASAAEKLQLDERNYRIGRLDTFYLIDSTNNLTQARLQRIQTQIQLQRMLVAYRSLADQLLARFPEVVQALQGE